jgi:hypothetical protein
MISATTQRVLIGIASTIILIVGFYFGDYLVTYLDEDNLEAVKIGLLFTTIVILLIFGSIVLELHEKLVYGSTQKKKKR